MSTIENGKKPLFKRPWFIILVVVIVLIIAINHSGKDTKESTKTATSTTKTDTAKTSDTTTKETKTYGEKETYTAKDGVTITMNSCNIYKSNDQYMAAPDGKEYIRAEFSIVNNSDSTLNVSSMADFSAYADDSTVNQTVTDSGDTQLDGEVAAGKNITGCIFYEVPQGTKTVEINYKPTVWLDQYITFSKTLQ